MVQEARPSQNVGLLRLKGQASSQAFMKATMTNRGFSLQGNLHRSHGKLGVPTCRSLHCSQLLVQKIYIPADNQWTWAL